MLVVEGSRRPTVRDLMHLQEKPLVPVFSSVMEDFIKAENTRKLLIVGVVNGTKKDGTATPDVGDCRSSTGGRIEKQMFLLSKEGNPYDIPGMDCPEEKKSSFFPNIQNNFELHILLHN
ncbi:hypothetical protein NPIL_444221 [Nephila pilipes]|uniref:Uncharacterized protein n=1 Tax=Nephila pilipes TaxID=299642 RepID=A0A8X6NTJ4_NEPPI|nr:hypothetical protein NPIL_444221 [Nephila pilipes]